MPDNDLISPDFATLPMHEYTLQRVLDRIRHRMVDRLYTATAVFAAVYSVVPMWRVQDIGWTMQLSVHTALTLVDACAGADPSAAVDPCEVAAANWRRKSEATR